MRVTTRWAWAVGILLMGTAGVAVADRDDDDDADMLMSPMEGAVMRARPMAAPRAARMGATPGGAQDIDYARERIEAGDVPHPKTFTPEGLFSDYDLPLQTGRPCSQLLCLSAAAVEADLVAQPQVRYLAQLGFASSLDARSWKRAPLNLVAVVDKSGSMGGAPLDTVKQSLHQVASQLDSRDQLSIILYGDRTHVHLPPTRLRDRGTVRRAIDAIQSEGSTYMEAGLSLGFQTARNSARGFAGTTRVMLFTDERPNVGSVDKGSFMGLARAASADGIGLTTVGVGTHFGAELATAVSSVRGGNLFFFPDVTAMQERFERDFDTMVTELAYDLRLRVAPAPGYALAGIYGIPGDLVKRVKGGGIEMTVETIFLSRDKGGIFFAFSRGGQGALPPAAGPIADIELSYVDTRGKRERDRLQARKWTGRALPLGLMRGRLLVDEITTLKKATALHLQGNDQQGAYQLVRALHTRVRQSGVPGLERELRMIQKLDATLTRLSGHGSEGPGVARRDEISGLPTR